MYLGKKLLTAGLLVATSFSSFAGTISGEEPTTKNSISVHQKGNFAYVRCTEAQANAVLVSIRNNEGAVIFQEKITNPDSFVRPYNMEQLADGQYHVEVKGNEVTTYTITLATKENSTKDAGVFLKNQVVDHNTMVVIVNNVTSPSTLKVYNNNGQQVYSEAITDNFGKKITFLGAEKIGDYTCKVVKN